jgi:hypothetical protein
VFWFRSSLVLCEIVVRRTSMDRVISWFKYLNLEAISFCRIQNLTLSSWRSFDDNIVTFEGVCVTNITGSGLDLWALLLQLQSNITNSTMSLAVSW